MKEKLTAILWKFDRRDFSGWMLESTLRADVTTHYREHLVRRAIIQKMLQTASLRWPPVAAVWTLQPSRSSRDHTLRLLVKLHQNHSTAVYELRFKARFLHFHRPESRWKLTVKARRWLCFKGSKMKKQIENTTRRERTTYGGRKCDVTPFHLITFGHVKTQMTGEICDRSVSGLTLSSWDQVRPCRIY